MRAISIALRASVVLAVAAFVAGCGERVLSPRDPNFVNRNGHIYFLIGDFVWNDLNHNGIQDTGEPGIPGVAVTVSGHDWLGYALPLDTTRHTDANGAYEFVMALPGTYTVTVTTPDGYEPTLQRQHQVLADTVVDSNGPAETVILDVDPAARQDNLTVDFGFWQPSRIGNFVWDDLNHNGIQDANEPGIGGVTVKLTGSTVGGTSVSLSTITSTAPDSLGYYQFADLQAGTYTVTVPTAPAGYSVTLLNQGNNAGIDSNNPAGTPVTLAAGVSDQTIDFGYYQPGSIGDYVWVDANHNGIQDNGELGLANAVVTLKDANGIQVGTPITTPSSGAYLFSNLPLGQYTVTVVPPVGYTASPLHGTTDTTKDSNANPYTTTLTATSPDNLTADFGYVPILGSIGDYVWVDANHNGIQDNGELGLANAVVTLKDANGIQVGTPITTPSSGAYLFSNLPLGQYTVTVVPPVGYTASPLHGTTDTTKDSNANPYTTTLTATSPDNLTADFGYVPILGSIGDYVWVDANHNGIQDNGELGLANAVVTLKDANGIQVGTPITTPSSGAYLFSNLPLGQYTVTVVPPVGYTASPLHGTTDTTKDSNANPYTTTLTATSPDNLTADFGYVPILGSIGDYVWVDANHNGIQDNGELGLANAVVTLKDANGIQVGTPITTPSSGAYLFSNLPLGQYTVTVVPPVGYTASPLHGTTDTTKDSNANPYTTTLTATSPDNLTADFGYVPILGSIGDYVWVDANHNGIQDNGELGLANAVVTLKDANGIQVGTPITTPSSGAYLFSNLPLGQYTVTVVPPVGYTASPLHGTTDTTKDSNANPYTTTLTATSPDNLTADFGYVPILGSIGDYVWVDANHNGIQDNGELGLANAVVTLKDANGIQVGTPITTPSSGAYLFSNLPLGQYTVTVVPPVGYTASPLHGTTDTTKDSNANPYTTTLTATSPDNLTADFGYVPILGSIGDYVWVDANHNGIQDNGELGLANAVVTLKDANGIQVGTPITTPSSGAYLFSNLPLGQYTVTVVPPVGYTASPLHGTTDTTKDSNANPYTTTLTATSPDNLTADFGYYVPPQNACVNGVIDNVLNIGALTNSLFFFANGSVDANWQGATKGFAGNVYVNGLVASERTSGSVPFAGTIYTNDSTLGAWQAIVNQNGSQAHASTGNGQAIIDRTAWLVSAIQSINSMNQTFGGSAGVSAQSLNGLGQSTYYGNHRADTVVINVTSGFQVSTQINIWGDSNDVFILRWDTDHNFSNGYQGQVKFQSGGAIVPRGGLTAANFISVAGDMNASGGGSNPPSPYPQGPGASGGSNFSGGGFFTGYWLTTGAPTTYDPATGLWVGATSPFSNAVFVGGWYTLTTKFSMTSGTSGVNVACGPWSGGAQ